MPRPDVSSKERDIMLDSFVTLCWRQAKCALIGRGQIG